MYENWSRFTSAVPLVVRAAGGQAERIDSLVAAGVVAGSAVFVVPLFSTRMLPEKDGKIWSGGSCWADLPIHMTIAESFLSGRNQDVSWGGLHSPVFAGEGLAYPFMPDFHAAVMVRLGGCGLRHAFLLPGLALCFSLLALMYLLTVRVTKSRIGGLLSILLLLGAGGMGGWNLAARDGFWEAATKDTAQNDAVGPDGRIVWFAFLPHVFLPQRGATFAYPLCLAILLMVRHSLCAVPCCVTLHWACAPTRPARPGPPTTTTNPAASPRRPHPTPRRFGARRIWATRA